MMRSLVVAGTLLLAVAGGLRGQSQASDAPPPGDPIKFSFYRTDGGYVRLDLHSGEVSFCRQTPTGWTCVVTADERAAYEFEISRLQTENVALKKTLLDHGLNLPAGMSVPPPPATAQNSAPEAKFPSDAEIDRVMSIFERIWRRLIEMMGNFQRTPDKT